MNLSAHRSLVFFAIITILEIGPAGAEDLAAGKSAPQLFASNCSMCHSTPRNLPRRTDNSPLADFLQEHYTTSQTSAYKLAGYLSVVGGSARRGKPQSLTSVSSQITAPAPAPAPLRPPASVPSR